MKEEDETIIKVYDAVMGSEKTTYIIEQMNKNKEEKYIYITPNIDECIRITEACPDLEFKQPSNEKVLS